MLAGTSGAYNARQCPYIISCSARPAPGIRDVAATVLLVAEWCIRTLDWKGMARMLYEKLSAVFYSCPLSDI